MAISISKDVPRGSVISELMTCPPTESVMAVGAKIASGILIHYKWRINQSISQS